MQGTCKLCKQEAELQMSHFIPKFIGRWVKKTSITGHLRHAGQMQKRAQDIAKEYWLCGVCEELFSSWETLFANKVFYPFVEEKKSTAQYGKWMAKFCASLSWRTLTYIRSKNVHEDRPPEYIAELGAAQKHLAEFILGTKDNLNQYEQHVIPVEGAVESASGGLPPNINRYFQRIMAMDIIGNNKNIFIYTKLPSFFVFGAIKSNELNRMRSSRIALNSGKISPREYNTPMRFRDYLIEAADKISELSGQIPNDQQAKIEKFILDNPDKAANSKQFEAFLQDLSISGDAVFKKD